MNLLEIIAFIRGDGHDGILYLERDLHMTRDYYFERIEWLGGTIYTNGFRLAVMAGTFDLSRVVASPGQIVVKCPP